jgi:hypothetical protein
MEAGLNYPSVPDPFSAAFVRGVDANRTLKEELTAAIMGQSARRRISVTDLVNPRQAFFRWTHPEVQPSPDRAQFMLAGTGFHDLFGRTVSTEEFVEQFIEYEGVVGKIDIYEDVPVELKTTGSNPDAPGAARPSYIDQLGMYCTMTQAGAGRLLLYRREQFGRQPALRAFRVEFPDLAPIRAEMLRRRDLFRDALDRGEPGDLPQCEWFGRNCDYAEICHCDTASVMTRVVPTDGCRIERDAAVERKFLEQLSSSYDRPAGFRLNDLVFPRKAAFERQVTDEEEEPNNAVEVRLRELERQGFRGTLYKALRFGIPGAFKNQPVKLRTLTDRVGMFRDVPTLMRVTKFREMVERDRLPQAMGHYFDRLAFECALSGHSRGRLVLYYEVLGEKFMVYDVGFKDVTAIIAEADRRLGLLEAGAAPSELPACPAWMFKFCRYRDRCGCGDAA